MARAERSRPPAEFSAPASAQSDHSEQVDAITSIKELADDFRHESLSPNGRASDCSSAPSPRSGLDRAGVRGREGGRGRVLLRHCRLHATAGARTMGLDDRDYMRERYRQRQGLDPGGTVWNDKKARREQASSGYKKAVPLGSASWIGKPIKMKAGGSGGGAWFSSKNRGFDYHRGRYRPSPDVRPHPLQGWIFLLSAIGLAIPAYREAKRAGWLPDWRAEVPFPSSGSVTVANGVDGRFATGNLGVRTDQANAVDQLFSRRTDEHIISVYVRRHDVVRIPVPPGTYRMKLVEGDKWHGPTEFFGPSTTFETVKRPVTIEPRGGFTIDLHRSPAGNLHTSINLQNPEPLD